MNLSKAARIIKLVILDVDGVLTNGTIGYGLGSDDEIKFFNVKDGCGVQMLRRAGLKVAIITGRHSKANRKRAEELGFDFIKENCNPKLPAFLELLDELSISAEECLYIGDDLIDWAVMKRCGISVAVADADIELRRHADFCTDRKGGEGAVREVAEWLLKEQGKWKEALAFYEF
ncbi:MAG: HAD-IIIA family hydrolase [Oligosphaeraceae bacterium]|nr:HAD-IIIA family hydrolase [Oligosphaeraceae bacterium]